MPVRVAYDLDGERLPADLIKKMGVTIGADSITIRPKVVAQRTVTLDGGKRRTPGLVRMVLKRATAAKRLGKYDIPE